MIKMIVLKKHCWWLISGPTPPWWQWHKHFTPCEIIWKEAKSEELQEKLQGLDYDYRTGRIIHPYSFPKRKSILSFLIYLYGLHHFHQLPQTIQDLFVF